MKTYFSFSVLVRIVASVFLFWALARHQFGYFVLLRWIVCSATVFCAYLSYSKKQVSWLWVFSFLTIMFNPIIPIRLDRETWAYFDIATCLFLLTSIYFIRESLAPKGESNV